MKKLTALVVCLCLLAGTVSARPIPVDVVTENRNGRQLITKTFNLLPEESPDDLADEPFDLEGFHYVHLDTIMEEHTFVDRKTQTETTVIETKTNSLKEILEELPPSVEYEKDGYTGTLNLDHNTIKTEASDYTSQRYTVTDTKQFTGLERNDPSFIPATTVKNGMTLKLDDISWAVTSTGLADDELLPTSYTATATYQAVGSRYVATGYTTEATYTGEITAQGVDYIRYYVSYLGTPLEEPEPPEPEPAPEPEPEPSPEPEPEPAPVIAAPTVQPEQPMEERVPEKSPSKLGPILLIVGATLFALAGALLLFFRLQPNVAVYALNAKGAVGRKLGKLRITARKPQLDFTRLREYPTGETGVEVQGSVARRLNGRILTIHLYDGVRTHMVESYDDNRNYWFAVSCGSKEEEDP